MSYLKFIGSGGTEETRPEGKKVFLSEHVEELEAALGLSIQIRKNSLIQAIGEKHPTSPEHPRTECLFDSELEVNKEQCKWCRSNRKCSIMEGNEFTGRIEIEMIGVEDSDEGLLRRILEDHLFNYGIGSEWEEEWASENLSSFLFNRRSPFVFSESNEFKKKMICQPLNYTRVIQPISEEIALKQPKFSFSPKLAYSPTLRRNLTIFELQILNSLWRERRGGMENRQDTPTCRDFLAEVMEEGASGFRIKREIERRIREESDSQDHIGLLMRRGGEMIMSVWDDWEEGVEVDFFEGWRELDHENPLDRVKQESVRFLEDLCQSMIDSEGKLDENISEVNFVESRSNGVIFQGERNVIPNSKHIGSRIVREIHLEGLSKNYILLDGEDYHSSAGMAFPNVHATRNPNANFAGLGRNLSLPGSPSNIEILKMLNSEISRRREDATIFDSKEILNAAQEGEKGYLLFDVFEYRSAGNFHDLIREQQLSSDYKDLIRFFNYLRSIGERGVNSKNKRIKKDAKEFLEKVKPELLAWEPDPLKIIESIAREEGGKFRVFVSLERKEEPQSPFITETVRFIDHSGEEENVIEFTREREKTDSEFRIFTSNAGGSKNRSRFKISSDPRKFRWPRSIRIYLQNCLSMGSSRKIQETPIIGALYLSAAVRNKVYESSIAAREVVKLLRERAHFSTLFVAMEHEKEDFSQMKDLGRISIQSGGQSEENMIFWNACRSPIESRNRMFIEVH